MPGIVDEALEKGKEDALDISNHTKALTKFIRETDTPITIGIQGEWGSGKTSLLNQLHYGLDNLPEKYKSENGEFKQIWVNSWEHSLLCTPEECLIKIINQIISELISSDESKKNREQIIKCVKSRKLLSAFAYSCKFPQNLSLIIIGWWRSGKIHHG